MLHKGESETMKDRMEIAKSSIDAVFGDDSVSTEVTRTRMQELVDYINEALETLKSDRACD